MFIPYDPDKYVSVFKTTTCEYHRRFPLHAFAGCTCSCAVGVRKATPEEYRARRRVTLQHRRDELERELRHIDAELAANADVIP